ncbi:hypothetical protein ASD35_21900 [Pelomonas sp. Root1444]|nr:hypothetical protein ASD35_21900 [Pelomonas sp. Root1444]
MASRSHEFKLEDLSVDWIGLGSKNIADRQAADEERNVLERVQLSISLTPNTLSGDRRPSIVHIQGKKQLFHDEASGTKGQICLK